MWVTDYHHDWIYPRAEQSLEELMPRILATWERKCVSRYPISSSFGDKTDQIIVAEASSQSSI